MEVTKRYVYSDDEPDSYYVIEQTSQGYRWVWHEPDEPHDDRGEIFPSIPWALDDAANDWENNGATLTTLPMRMRNAAAQKRRHGSNL